MKKIIKNNLLGFILGGIIFGGIVYAASYVATDISYTPIDSSWEVSNVGEAINNLYNIKSDLDNMKSIGDANSSDIALGKTAVVKGNTITGTAVSGVSSISFQVVSVSITNNPFIGLQTMDISGFNTLKIVCSASWGTPTYIVTIDGTEKYNSNTATTLTYDISNASTLKLKAGGGTATSSANTNIGVFTVTLSK